MRGFFVFMEFVVYILYSRKFDNTYVGFTTSLIERFKSHNELSMKGHTIKFRPWEVMYTEFFDCKTDAIRRENWFKTGIGREFITLKKAQFIELQQRFME